MAFMLPILEGAGAGLLGSAAGGILGGATGNAENAAMSALNTQDETFQLGMYASEIQNQEQLQVQSEVFDQMMDERSENMREVDTVSQETSRRESAVAAFERIIATLRELQRAPLEYSAQ